jgi:hypothetical protein
MEYLIYNYTGYENEFEVAVFENGKINFDFYVSNINTTLSIDQHGFGKVKINAITCITYNEKDEPIYYILSQEQISILEKELPEYIDWNEWINWKSQPDDDYEERRLNSLD